MCGANRKDRKNNIFICEQLGIVLIEDKMKQIRLKWCGHVLKRTIDTVVRRSKMINVNDKRSRRRPKKILIETIYKDLNTLN